MSQASPAVERAAERVKRFASARVGHWLLALTDDEDGKPASLIARAGLDLAAVRAALDADPGPAAPAERQLFADARATALELTSDATLTTDALLLTLLDIDTAFAPGGLTGDLLRAQLAPNPNSLSAADPGHELVIGELDNRAEAARAVDANLNRARESLRVLDDYARFVRADRGLTAVIKSLRHRLAESESLLPAGLLITSRDAANDVGTTVGVGGEYARSGTLAVAVANLKRLQESLRSAEEFGKILSTSFAKSVEAVRYESYTLEKAFRPPSALRDRLQSARLYALLTGSQCVAALDWTVAELAEGGVQIVQLREKSMPDRELVRRARDARRWTADAGLLFIVNDRPDIARLADADGVHLGQDDVTAADARRIVGPDALVGVSTHNLNDVSRARLDGADYIGVGPTFPSRTKSFDSFPGLEFVREAFASTSLPAFALGGVDLSNVAQLAAVGCGRAAVGAALMRADEPGPVAAQLARALAVAPLTPIPGLAGV